MSKAIEFIKDFDNFQITVSHRYKADIANVWDAFTVSEIIEKWWAPQPYKAIVIKNDFKINGKLHYYMLSPEGEKHYCIAEYLSIDKYNSYTLRDAFCDEHGVINTSFPRMRWKNSFNQEGVFTKVTNIISFENQKDMKQNLDMGFEEGYKMGLNQLNDLLNSSS